MKRATVSADGETITVHIPMTFRKRGGRKLVVTPDGRRWAPRPRVDNAMVKALARAFRWRKMLDDGRACDDRGLGPGQGRAATYVSRVLRLTLLAPEIVEAILDGRQPAELQLDDLLTGFRWSGRGSANPRRLSAIHPSRPDQPPRCRPGLSSVWSIGRLLNNAGEAVLKVTLEVGNGASGARALAISVRISDE